MWVFVGVEIEHVELRDWVVYTVQAAIFLSFQRASLIGEEREVKWGLAIVCFSASFETIACNGFVDTFPSKEKFGTQMSGGNG